MANAESRLRRKAVAGQGQTHKVGVAQGHVELFPVRSTKVAMDVELFPVRSTKVAMDVELFLVRSTKVAMEIYCLYDEKPKPEDNGCQ